MGALRGLSEGGWAGGGGSLGGKGVGTQLERPAVGPGWGRGALSPRGGEGCVGIPWGLGVGDTCPKVLCLLPSPTAERGVKTGNHRGERKDKNVVESLGYPGGALEAAAEGEHCSWSPVAVGLANCPLDMVGTLRGIERMAGNPCGSRVVTSGWGRGVGGKRAQR